MKTSIASVYSCHSPPPITIRRCTRNNLLNSRNRYLELFTAHIIGSPCLFNVNFTSYQCQSIIYQRLGIVRPKLSNFDSCATCPPHVHPSSNTRPTLGLPQTPVKPYYSPIPSFKSRCFWKLEIMKWRITRRFGLENFCFHTSQNNTKYANVNPIIVDM